ncbi:hypothetical protein [Actinoplanes sp. NPDC051859]|uniref:hypothetical protein n=1 Tax=Actinoplanes sp. NPDC051859 TaxID=3363909 RepID=UPI0037BDC708
MTSTDTVSLPTPQFVDDHAAPVELTVDRAHELMREHLRCTAETCGARRSALALLVRVGRYVLDGNSRR